MTRKISIGVARILNEMKHNYRISPIQIGNLNSIRDWGHASDFCRAFYSVVSEEQN